MVPTVAFASGKGGVGKSTIAVNVGAALANDGLRVGLVDADVYGPDIPAMVGITRRTATRSITLWQAGPAEETQLQPVEAFGMRIMSPQFLISEDQSLDWQSPLVDLLLRRLVTGVDWGVLDILLVDLPPGTADLQQQLFELLPSAFAVLVTTPQLVSHLDARKLVSMLEKRGVTILGGVENMAGMSCPHCGHDISLFSDVKAENTIWNGSIDLLAKIPFMPPTPTATGVPMVVADPDMSASLAVTEAARKIRSATGL